MTGVYLGIYTPNPVILVSHNIQDCFFCCYILRAFLLCLLCFGVCTRHSMTCGHPIDEGFFAYR